MQQQVCCAEPMQKPCAAVGVLCICSTYWAEPGLVTTGVCPPIWGLVFVFWLPRASAVVTRR